MPPIHHFLLKKVVLIKYHKNKKETPCYRGLLNFVNKNVYRVRIVTFFTTLSPTFTK